MTPKRNWLRATDIQAATLPKRTPIVHSVTDSRRISLQTALAKCPAYNFTYHLHRHFLLRN